MKAITEEYLRSLSRKQSLESITLEEGQILTPSARGFLGDNKIPIRQADEKVNRKSSSLSSRASAPEEKGETGRKPQFVSALDGGLFTSKPEHMTHLRGNRLISKDHPCIVFRGMLDCFQAELLLAQSLPLEKGMNGLVDDLEEILQWAREIMKADVLNKELPVASVFGLTPDELRQHSHNPKEFYGVGHITPSVHMGRIMLQLNQLRSSIRAVETAAVHAFKGEFNYRRQDILEGLNRMSSAIYILMVREKAGVYVPK